MLKQLSLLIATILFISTGHAMPSKQFSAWITQEMKKDNIPGVSIAVIKNYKIEWAMGFGLADKSTGRPVTTDTLFQAASISKPVTTVAVLESVQADKFQLDEPINNILSSWKLPDNQYTNKHQVTLRRLLSHSAGINVHGFVGYASDEALPSLLDVLNGEGAANSEAILVVSEPGKQFEYSGGGYVIIQQGLLDVYHKPFPDIMNQLVLTPLNMTNSTFQQPLSASLMNNIAVPYRPDGKPVTGGPHTYVELAAAGLWTTPSDLAKFAIAIQQSLRGVKNQLLTQQSARLMVTPIAGYMGLGLMNTDKDAQYTTHGHYFMHGGQNEGYRSLLIASIKDGNGAIIMTNMTPDSSLETTHRMTNKWNFTYTVVKKIAAMQGWR